MKDARFTYRRRHSYRTKSNRARPVKTPGGRLVARYIKKAAAGPKCGVANCNVRLQGLPRLRPAEYARLPKSQRTVSRAYGGSLCAPCVRDRIVRAFIIEEQKIVKQVLLEKARKNKAAKGKK